MIKIHEKEIETDREGYLMHRDDWSEEVAIVLAQQADIALEEAHWVIIHFLRAFYEDYQMMPARRILLKELLKLKPFSEQFEAEKNKNTAFEIHLNQLFPGGFAKRASQIAGLPKPTRCI